MIGAAAGVIGILSATESPHRVFAFLQNASGALMVFIYMLIALAQITLRRERERRGEAAPALKMWLFPWASYAAIACITAVVVAMAVTPGQQQDLYFSLHHPHRCDRGLHDPRARQGDPHRRFGRDLKTRLKNFCA